MKGWLAAQHANPDQILIVEYEELLMNPTAEIATIYDFLDIDRTKIGNLTKDEIVAMVVEESKFDVMKKKTEEEEVKSQEITPEGASRFREGGRKEEGKKRERPDIMDQYQEDKLIRWEREVDVFKQELEVDKDEVSKLKDEGNAQYAINNFVEAVDLYSQAISLTPSNHLLYSNRCAAYMGLENWEEGESDAKLSIIKCTNEFFGKGYLRLARCQVFI